MVRLRDPAGLQVEVVHGVAAAPGREPPPPAPVNSFERPVRINAPRPAVLGPAWVRRLGHVVLGRQEFERNVSWYLRTLGLIASDVEVLVELGEPIVAFLRFDRGDTPCDHHSIVVAAAPEDGYLHAAFESTDVDALGAGAEWLQHQGWVKSWGIGRHVLGSQLFCYHVDPHGFDAGREPRWLLSGGDRHRHVLADPEDLHPAAGRPRAFAGPGRECDRVPAR